jgi:hypothetical protein
MELILCVWPHAFWPEGRAEGPARRRARPLGRCGKWFLWMWVINIMHHALLHLT